jgi:hypothetical protein
MHGLIIAVHAAVQPWLNDGGRIHSRECSHLKEKRRFSSLINVLTLGTDLWFQRSYI